MTKQPQGGKACRHSRAQSWCGGLQAWRQRGCGSFSSRASCWKRAERKRERERSFDTREYYKVEEKSELNYCEQAKGGERTLAKTNFSFRAAHNGFSYSSGSRNFVKHSFRRQGCFIVVKLYNAMLWTRKIMFPQYESYGEPVMLHLYLY